MHFSDVQLIPWKEEGGEGPSAAPARALQDASLVAAPGPLLGLDLGWWVGLERHLTGLLAHPSRRDPAPELSSL